MDKNRIRSTLSLTTLSPEQFYYIEKNLFRDFPEKRQHTITFNNVVHGLIDIYRDDQSRSNYILSALFEYLHWCDPSLIWINFAEMVRHAVYWKISHDWYDKQETFLKNEIGKIKQQGELHD